MLARIRELIPADQFSRGVAVLAGGTAAGQAIAVLASPILTRLYGPADFGVFAVYTSVIAIAGSCAALSYHQAIPLPEEDTEAAQALGVSLISALLVFGLTTAVVVVVGPRLVALLNMPRLEPYLWMIPLGVLGLSAYEVMTQWAVRQKSFSVISRVNVVRGVTQTGTQIGFGLGGVAPIGLLFGQLVGQWVGTGSLFRDAVRHSGRALREMNLAAMRLVAGRYKDFPRYTAPSMLMNVVGADAPPLLLSFFFGGTVTGLFALCARVLMMPVSLIAKSASQVFFASAPGYLREDRLGVEIERILEKMLRLSLGPVLILAVAAPDFFTFVFGEKWSEAGIYARWLCPWLLMVFVGFPLGPVVAILERQRAGLVFQGVLAAARVGSLVVGGLSGHALLAIGLFGATSGLCWAAYLAWLLVIGGASLSVSLLSFSRLLLKSLPFVVPVAGCSILDFPNWITVFTAVACVIAVVSFFTTRRPEGQ